MMLTYYYPKTLHLFDPSHVPILQKFGNFTVKTEFYYVFIKHKHINSVRHLKPSCYRRMRHEVPNLFYIRRF
jgi:hypothetical protein